MNDDSVLRVYLFNIGAGDHIMLEFPDGSLGIIDFYFQANPLGLSEVPALTYLRHLRDEKKRRSDDKPIVINFLCISHADLDHLTGLDELLEFVETPDNNTHLENLWLFGRTEIENCSNGILDKN